MAGQQRAVVVTGAAKGIGRACVLRLSRAGFRVYAGVRNAADGETLRAASGTLVVPLHIDITDADTIAAATAAIRSDLDGMPLIGLVNNAGIAIAGPLEFLPLEDLRRQLEVNVVGQVAMTQAMMPMLRAARGRIVNMGSISGRSALPLVGPYAASKHALEAITDSLRVEVLSAGVDVVIIEPGVIATPIWQTSIAEAVKMLENAPQAVHHYGRLLKRIGEQASRAGSRGLPADVVARVVEKALTVRRPRTRYIVGRDARLRALFQHLPDRWRDRVIAWQLSRI